MGRIDIIEISKFVLEIYIKFFKQQQEYIISYERETCINRDIMRDLKCVDKLIKGEGITCMERVEINQL